MSQADADQARASRFRRRRLQRPLLKIALVAGSRYEDATTHSVFSGLDAALRRLGHDVLLVARPTAGSGGLAFAGPGRAKVRRVGSVRALERLARERRVDLVHLHFSGWMRPWLMALSRWPASAPRLVVTFQDYAHPELPRNSLRVRAALRGMLGRAHAVTAVSDFLRKRLEDDLPELRGRVRVVYNGCRSSQGSRRFAKPYILSVGRLAPYKGPDLLLMAFSLLERDDVDLVLCGAPFHGRHIERLVTALRLEGRVRLTGLLPPARVQALIDGCLFYAAAPRTETFGMALVEAMAAGKAVLATRVGAIPEYLSDGRNGLVVEPGDVRGLAAEMKRLLGSPRLRASLGAAAVRTARSLSWTRAAEGYLAAYSRPVKRH